MSDRSDLACGGVRPLLAAFLADELPAPESRRVQDHLDGCPACSRFSRFESAFDASLDRSLGREAAPASLVVKVHRALDEEDAGLRFRPGRALRGRWGRVALAASVLFGLLGVAAAVRSGLVTLPVAAAGVARAAEGILVCAECERHGTPLAVQRGCRAHGHHTALRTMDGEMWEFVDSDLSRPLITDAGRIGDRLRVEGLFIGGLRYVRVDGYRYLGRGENTTQGL